MNNIRKTGTIVRFTENGFGFIYCKEEGRRVFFHANDFNRETDPAVGESVEFELAPSKTPGMPDAAVKVQPIAKATEGGAA